MLNQVVARFRDGRTLKGTSLNVDPARPTFHVRTAAGPVEVVLAELKALFFVKDHAGDPKHQEAAAPTRGDARLVGGHRLVRPPPAERYRPRSAASRIARNSLPGRHSGYRAAWATRYPTVSSSRTSSTAPSRSQSGLISSDGLW
jgi:hypothetical protein